jgi:hypothetical protein
MTFIGLLMMYNNFSVTVYGPLNHVHIFSDFPAPPATLDLPVSVIVLRGAQAVGLGPHLSHLIYICKSKITKGSDFY